MKKSVFMVLILNVLVGTVAFAECTYNGEKHPEGSIIGPYICTDGEWIFK